MIEEYDILQGHTCEECGDDEDVTMDEDGNLICTSCLFEKACEERFGGNDGY